MATTPVSKTIDQIDALESPTRNTKVLLGAGNKIYVNFLASILALVTKEDVGLSNVDNTADLSKPISNATAQALQDKASAADLQALAQVVAEKASQADLDALVEAAQNFVTSTELGQALQQKANISHTHDLSDIDELTQILSGFAPANHQHSQTSIQNLTTDLNDIRQSILGKAAVSHTHTASSITGMTEAIVDVLTQLPNIGSVTSGNNEW